ncbi:L-lactate dehydrogenase (quinone) large subunit LdhH [Thermodesulforhabdus norvegica]|uniref:Iron-sulfur cluster-binding protein n=1 Tax=Thermodesulforhabdus norvegica TaxID=39841 RepID=A0A1I4W6N5_9BACT|nr:LUD domain-containing protein [Thermodesulforhabdus norvegica]SFN09298.1 iron-sulfur cluster-binding protein [Thermodesulforhabdus norvegica]
MERSPRSIKKYRSDLAKALENEYLRTTLDNFALSYREARGRAFEGIDFEGLRLELGSSRQSAVEKLEELYARFKEKAEEKGAVVYRARTALEANEIIHRIAQDAGARKIVKSKSMTAEEIFLNAYLEKRGYRVVETDLGEWIIQLCGHGPSHMVMPAIHLCRRDVAEIFQKYTGQPIDPEDIGAMVALARRELRKEFIEAHVGISGANFAVAETGTLGIVTNEGNARLVTTLPPVHIALVGLDKLVPDTGTALRILRLLPRNATGQPISTYVTWISGAVPWNGDEGGQKRLYIVFLDNGRSEIAKDPIFGEVLRCIRCGACANVCPIYRLVGGHNYGHVYIGAIGLILTYFYHGAENDEALVRNCLNCQACKEVCPVGIDLPYLIKETYGKVLEYRGRKPVKNLVLAKVLKNRRLFHFLLRRARLIQKPIADSDGMIRHLPFFFMKEHSFRSLPSITAHPFRDRWPSVKPEPGAEREKVGFFAGCLIDFVYPEQAESAMKIFERLGVSVTFPEGQTCCGLPALMASEKETARLVALQNIGAFARDASDCRYIVTLCASCGSHMKENYPRLFYTPEERSRAVEFSKKIVDFSSFVLGLMGDDEKSFFSSSGETVTYHAPCHLCRGLKVKEAPRRLISVAGYVYAPCPEEEVCCGLGGSYSLEFPEISRELLSKKLDDVLSAGARYLVTDCPGCLLQLRGGMDRRGNPVRVLHMAELLAKALR